MRFTAYGKGALPKKVKLMRVRYFVSLSLAFLCVMLTAGLVQRAGYTDMNERERPLEDFEIGILGDSVAEAQIEKMSSTLKEQPLILAVTCTSDYYFRFKCATQTVTVDKVFAGDSVSKGDEISLLMCKAISGKDDVSVNGRSSINMGFTDQMKTGGRYLVFLSKKLKNSKDPIYLFSDEFFINPVFAYDDIDNKPLESEIEGAYFTAYKEAQGNEFFLNSQASVEKFKALKKAVISAYRL